MSKEYIYKIIRVDREGNQIGKRAKRFYRFDGVDNYIEVGGIYRDLGPGYPGFHKVIELEKVKEYPD